MLTCKDIARRDRVHTDSGRCQFVSETDREPYHAGLCNRVGQKTIDVSRKTGSERQTGDRSDKNDRAFAARTKMWNCVLGDKELNSKRVVESPAPIAQRSILDGPG